MAMRLQIRLNMAGTWGGSSKYPILLMTLMDHCGIRPRRTRAVGWVNPGLGPSGSDV